MREKVLSFLQLCAFCGKAMPMVSEHSRPLCCRACSCKLPSHDENCRLLNETEDERGAIDVLGMLYWMEEE